MRRIFFKTIDILGTLLNFGLLIFFMWGTAVYAPNSPATPFVWMIGFAVFLYIVFRIILKINDVFVERNMQRYINSGFEPKSINEYFR